MRSRIQFSMVPDPDELARDHYGASSHWVAFLDGVQLDASVSRYDPSGLAVIETTSREVRSRLLSLTIAEAAETLEAIYLPFVPPRGGLLDELGLFFLHEARKPSAEVMLRIHPRLEQWDRPWSLVALAEVIESLVQEDPLLRLPTGVDSYSGYRDWEMGIRFCLALAVTPDIRLQDLWEVAIERTDQLLERAIVRLDRMSTTRQRSVEQLFEFPAPVRAACEQYLMYFAQFLRDLGVDADASLTETAGRVLFSVTPRSGEEALARVREALDAYLALADNPQVFNQADGDIAVQQLGANVFHLRSQLQLARAIMAAKDAQIEALETTNSQLRQHAGPALLDGRPADEEPVVAGIVTLKPYEAKGVTIHLPEILRRLKRRWSE